jgi:RNA polymerase primary sigma factor
LYDTLLDDLEDDVTPNPDEAVELVDKAVDVDDVDDDLLVDDSATMADLDIDGKTEELLAEEEDIESWSDDPVRMYLTQMGEIPLLTRQEEIALAKKIERIGCPARARAYMIPKSLEARTRKAGAGRRTCPY